MSRGFVKEDDQEEAPFIPPRAALPPGVTNYVTPVGYEKLLAEKQELEKERVNLRMTSDKEKRHAQAVLDGKINLVGERINSARILRAENQSKTEIRFGARIRFKILNGDRKNEENSFQIVGVDEADINEGKIAFLAPLARAVTGKKTGDKVEFQLGKEVQLLEILEVKY